MIQSRVRVRLSRYNPAQLPLTLTPGTRLSSYEILSALGAGGMGEVYRLAATAYL